MKATARHFTILFVLAGITAFVSACATGLIASQSATVAPTPAASATPTRSSPIPSAMANPTPLFVETEQSDMPPSPTQIAGLSRELDAARANGTWVPIYPASMDALALQESGLRGDKPNNGAYLLPAEVQGRIDIVNPYRGGSVDWRLIKVITRPFSIDPNHTYAGQESITILPGRYLERTSDHRSTEIAVLQLKQGNRVDIWFRDNTSSSPFDITVVLVGTP